MSYFVGRGYYWPNNSSDPKPIRINSIYENSKDCSANPTCDSSPPVRDAVPVRDRRLLETSS